VSVTAGTLFTGARSPLTVWFELVWRFASSKQGISALEAMRDLGIGSYRTAWGMCQRLRRVVVAPGRDRLSGRVEVDETYVGGVEKGLPGGRARGKKALVGIAVETKGGGRLGRARLGVLADASEASLGGFLADAVEPGSTVVTDAWQGYSKRATKGYLHERASHRQALQAGADRDELLPGAHRVASLVKRWLLATHQGAASAAHLQEYLDEWVFRFNRRSSRSRGLLFYRVMQLAVGHRGLTYAELVADPLGRPGQAPPSHGTGGSPPTLAHAYSDRPWRKNSLR
jgi:transposase-like protein